MMKKLMQLFESAEKMQSKLTLKFWNYGSKEKASL